MMSEMQAEKQTETYNFGDSFVSLLGSLIVGIFVAGGGMALVAAIRFFAAPGMSIKELFERFELLPPPVPPFIDLSAIRISIGTPANPTLAWWFELVLLNLPWVIGVLAAGFAYGRILRMSAEN